MPAGSIIICALLIGLFVLFFLPVEKFVSKTLGLHVKRVIAPIILLVLTTAAILYLGGISSVFYVALAAFSLWAFLFGFFLDSKYPYFLALIFLILCPILLAFKLDNIAEFSAVLAYICLVLGVIKDIFYDKIIETDKHD